jgi:hypothetical protein
MVLEKYPTIKFHKNPLSGVMMTEGRTDRHDKANSRLRNFAILFETNFYF